MDDSVPYQNDHPISDEIRRPLEISLLESYAYSNRMTSSSNNTWEYETQPEPSIPWLIVVPLVVGLIIIITVVGNVFVMLAYWGDSRIHGRVASLIILNLAISDFIIGLFVLSINLAWITWNELLGGEYWLLGETFCKIWLVIDNTASMMSVLTIILISLDRYWLLTKKLHYSRFQTRRRVLLTIAILWISTTAVYSLLAFGWTAFTGEAEVDFSEECELDMAYNVYASSVQLILEFLIPLGIIVVLNAIVYVKIKKRSKGLKDVARSKVPTTEMPSANPIESDHKSTTSATSALSASNINLILNSNPRLHVDEDFINVSESTFSNSDAGIQNETDQSQKAQQKSTSAQVQNNKREFARHRRAAFVLAVLVTVFIACWLPYQIVNLVNAICGDECISVLVWEIVNNILWCNSFINPFLYAATNVHFRRNFIVFLGLRRFRCFRRTMQTATQPSTTADRAVRRRGQNMQK